MSTPAKLIMWGSMGVSLMGEAMAHPSVMPHPETASDVMHLAVHALMVLPVVAGAWLLVWGAKRLTAAQRRRG